MTPTQILDGRIVLQQRLLPHTTLPPTRYDTRALPHGDTDAMVAHLLWMLEQIPGQIAADRTAKAMRWLTFIQGAMWALGLTNIDDMKDMNR